MRGTGGGIKSQGQVSFYDPLYYNVRHEPLSLDKCRIFLLGARERAMMCLLLSPSFSLRGVADKADASAPRADCNSLIRYYLPQLAAALLPPLFLSPARASLTPPARAFVLYAPFFERTLFIFLRALCPSPLSV